ncbi:hypothetical protein Agub_g1142 [Astrephomene gubernaculifera]|uniref:CBS domain-containing protein n=1 Tax=Astrephomene gubernaculifera TaxID=47775 RepID=A0AAD3HHH4_9CHLO|nr:hypothetical protein Agub_g1142 [Astrephomene gubernaculifera]
MTATGTLAHAQVGPSSLRSSGHATPNHTSRSNTPLRANRTAQAHFDRTSTSILLGGDSDDGCVRQSASAYVPEGLPRPPASTPRRRRLSVTSFGDAGDLLSSIELSKRHVADAMDNDSQFLHLVAMSPLRRPLDPVTATMVSEVQVPLTDYAVLGPDATVAHTASQAMDPTIRCVVVTSPLTTHVLSLQDVQRIARLSHDPAVDTIGSFLYGIPPSPAVHSSARLVTAAGLLLRRGGEYVALLREGSGAFVGLASREDLARMMLGDGHEVYDREGDTAAQPLLCTDACTDLHQAQQQRQQDAALRYGPRSPDPACGSPATAASLAATAAVAMFAGVAACPGAAVAATTAAAGLASCGAASSSSCSGSNLAAALSSELSWWLRRDDGRYDSERLQRQQHDSSYQNQEEPREEAPLPPPPQLLQPQQAVSEAPYHHDDDSQQAKQQEQQLQPPENLRQDDGPDNHQRHSSEQPQRDQQQQQRAGPSGGVGSEEEGEQEHGDEQECPPAEGFMRLTDPVKSGWDVLDNVDDAWDVLGLVGNTVNAEAVGRRLLGEVTAAAANIAGGSSGAGWRCLKRWTTAWGASPLWTSRRRVSIRWSTAVSTTEPPWRPFTSSQPTARSSRVPQRSSSCWRQWTPSGLLAWAPSPPCCRSSR